MNAYILNQKEKETIEQNIKLAYWKAHKWAKVLQNHAILDELISCCEMGLISAVHTCDYSRSNKLATYANVCMDNQVKMYLRGSTSKAIPFSSLTYMDNDGSEYSEIENIADPNESPDDIVEKQELLRQLERLPKHGETPPAGECSINGLQLQECSQH